MGARGWRANAEEGKNAAARGSVRLAARDNFEELKLLPVGDGLGDRDRRGAAEDDDRVRAHPVRADDVLDRRTRALKLDALDRLVKPAAYLDFGRNPSSRLRWQTLKTETCL